MIEIRLTPVRVESVRLVCDDDTDEHFHLAVYDLIRPQITAIDAILQRLTAAANSAGVISESGEPRGDGAL